MAEKSVRMSQELIIDITAWRIDRIATSEAGRDLTTSDDRAVELLREVAYGLSEGREIE